MSGRLSRLGRWVVPAALLTAAGSAVVFLAADELLDHSAPAPSSLVEPLRGDRSGSRANVVALAPAPARSGAATPVPPIPLTPTPPPARPSAPGPQARPLVRETPEVLRASQYLAQLARVPSLPERLETMEAILSGLPDQEALRVMEGLLDSELPGDLYEAESLRLALLGKVARCAGGRADRILVERLDVARPRPERLAAIDALASRAAARGELEAIASHDHDQVVQRKARWALQRTP